MGSQTARRSEIRSDHVLWLEESKLTPGLAAYWASLAALRVAMNRCATAVFILFSVDT